MGTRIRAFLAVALLGLGLAVALGRAEAPREPLATGSRSSPIPAWGTPRVVPVVNGRADVRVSRAGDGPLLIVAAALAHEGAPFALSLRAEPAEGADPLLPWEPPSFATRGVAETRIAADSDPEPSSKPLESREFWLPIRPGTPADAARYVPIQARLIEVGRSIQIYVDGRDRDRLDPALAASLVRVFDDEIRPRSAKRWGTARDVDGDGRFTVLLTSWLGHLKRQGEPVEGCFRGADLDLAVPPPFGNRCDMVCLDARLAAGPHAKTVLIHEYAHAVLFTHKVLSAGRVAAEEDESGWLDEAMAHLVEDDHAASGLNSNLDRRLAAYQAVPEAFPLVLPDDLADGAAFATGGGSRGAATLFLRWCAQGVSDPDELLRRLARPGATGVANIERATGVPFPDLLRGWSISQFLASEATGSARPAVATVAVGGPPHHWEARPTSVHYVLVAPGEAERHVRVRIDAPADALLQVTAIPLAARTPRSARSRSD